MSRTSISAGAKLSVQDALVDPEATQVGWVLVEMPDASSETMKVDLSGGEPVPVEIPVTLCLQS